VKTLENMMNLVIKTRTSVEKPGHRRVFIRLDQGRMVRMAARKVLE